jgi:hypothetical protein
MTVFHFLITGKLLSGHPKAFDKTREKKQNVWLDGTQCTYISTVGARRDPAKK